MTKQILDTYLDLCTQVYELSKPIPPEDAYAFYRSYVADYKGPILEPMCGTGRFLLPLIEEGVLSAPPGCTHFVSWINQPQSILYTFAYLASRRKF